MHKIPVIIDTDPGIDDFFALAVAAASDKLDIRAITPVAGNQTYEKVCRNVENIRQLFRRDVTYRPQLRARQRCQCFFVHMAHKAVPNQSKSNCHSKKPPVFYSQIMLPVSAPRRPCPQALCSRR